MAYVLQLGIAFFWHNGIFVIDFFLLNGIVLIGIVLIGIVLYNYKLQEPGVYIGVFLFRPFSSVFLLIKQILCMRLSSHL
jgi:hypothetical protein